MCATKFNRRNTTPAPPLSTAVNTAPSSGSGQYRRLASFAPGYTQGMDAPKRPRFQFGLRWLLALVGMTGLAFWMYLQLPRQLPQKERQRYVGMARDEIENVLGTPEATLATINDSLLAAYSDGLTVEYDIDDGGVDRCSRTYYVTTRSWRSRVGGVLAYIENTD